MSEPRKIKMFDVTQQSLHLRILATSDLHAALSGYDYFAERDTPGMGLSRVAGLIRIARSEQPNSLLFDNGDLVQGNPLGDWIARADAAGHLPRNPFIDAMNALRYDAATLGNHDFNFGLPYIAKAVSEARFEVVLSNLAATGPLTPAALDLPRWTILDRQMRDHAGQQHCLRIGVLGLSPPQVVVWEKDNIAGALSAMPPLDAARDLVPKMRAAGADIIVALCHGGIGRDGEGPENVALGLAQMGGIDAIVMGHLHDLFPKTTGSYPAGVDAEAGTLDGVPAVMPGAMGSHLGQIDLRLEPAPKGGWQVAECRSTLRPVARRGSDGRARAQAAEDAAIKALIAPVHRAALRDMGRVVARLPDPLHSYFAFAGVDRSLRIVTRTLRLAAQRFVEDTSHPNLPVLAAGSPFRCGGLSGPENYTDIPAGDITLRDIASLYPFPDRLVVLRVDGACLHRWLEHAARAFNQVSLGAQDALLINTDVPSYHFDVIDGLSYRIDLSQKPGARIRDLRYGNAPLRPDAQFLLATNNYRAGGGGGFPGADRVLSVPDQITDLLRAGLIHPQPLDPEPFWTFTPLPGTTCLLRTGPGAAAHMADIAGLKPKPCGFDASGFATFRLTLGPPV